MTMLLLLVVLHAGLYVSSASAPEKNQAVDEYVALYKELAYFPERSQWNLDHVAGLRNIADKSHELATKAAKAAVFAARGVYQTEPTERRTLLEPLKTVLEQSATLYSTVWYPAFDRLDTEVQSFMEAAQRVLHRPYDGLLDYISVPSRESAANHSSNRLLIGACTKRKWLDDTLCMLQVYGSIFGSNCSIAYSSSCEDDDWSHKKHVWDAPSAIEECANEQIARLSTDERTLNGLAMYARRNVFLTFNFLSFCSAFNESYDGVIPDSIQIVRSIADGFALSKQEIVRYLSPWPLLAKNMTAKRLTTAALKLPRGEVDEVYNRTASDIVSELKNTWRNHEFSAVVYYSYTGPLESDVVLYDGSEEDSFNINETEESIKAFVKRYTFEDVLRVNEHWKSVEEDPETIAELFVDDEPSTSVTERFRKAKLDAKLFDEGGFRAAAVLPCAYRFVWYELAWQYFHAYGTTSPYFLTFRGKNAYKQCGVVVLFP